MSFPNNYDIGEQDEDFVLDYQNGEAEDCMIAEGELMDGYREYMDTYDIEMLTIQPRSKKGTFEIKDICVFCDKPVSQMAGYGSFKCGHKFHFEGKFLDWLQKGAQGKCPNKRCGVPQRFDCTDCKRKAGMGPMESGCYCGYKYIHSDELEAKLKDNNGICINLQCGVRHPGFCNMCKKMFTLSNDGKIPRKVFLKCCKSYMHRNCFYNIKNVTELIECPAECGNCWIGVFDVDYKPACGVDIVPVPRDIEMPRGILGGLSHSGFVSYRGKRYPNPIKPKDNACYLCLKKSPLLSGETPVVRLKCCDIRFHWYHLEDWIKLNGFLCPCCGKKFENNTMPIIGYYSCKTMYHVRRYIYPQNTDSFQCPCCQTVIDDQERHGKSNYILAVKIVVYACCRQLFYKSSETSTKEKFCSDCVLSLDEFYRPSLGSRKFTKYDCMYCKCKLSMRPNIEQEHLLFDCGHLLHNKCFISTHFDATGIIDVDPMEFPDVPIIRHYKCLICGYIQVMDKIRGINYVNGSLQFNVPTEMAWKILAYRENNYIKPGKRPNTMMLESVDELDGNTHYYKCQKCDTSVPLDDPRGICEKCGWQAVFTCSLCGVSSCVDDYSTSTVSQICDVCRAEVHQRCVSQWIKITTCDYCPKQMRISLPKEKEEEDDGDIYMQQGSSQM